jgi:uncharacterized protein YjaZ
MFTKMKRSIFLTSALVFALQFSFFAQTNKKVTPPSDASTGFTYDFDKTNDLIIERLSNPNKSNEDVKVIVEEKSFPKLNKGENIDTDFKKKVAVWIEKNPNLIISSFKYRSEIVHPY